MAKIDLSQIATQSLSGFKPSAPATPKVDLSKIAANVNTPPKKTFGQKIIGALDAANKFVLGEDYMKSNTEKDFAQRAAAAPIGVLGGIAKVGESTVGKAIDYGTEKLYGGLNKVFGTNVQPGKGAGTTKKIVDKTLGESAKSNLYKGGEVIGKNLPSIAATSGLGTPTGSVIGRMAKAAPIGAVRTEANALLTEGRNATPKELLIGAGLESIGAGVFGKSGKAEKIGNMLKDTEKVADKRAALRAGNLKDQPGGIKNFLFGGGDVVQESKRTKAATETILQQIKDPSTKPVALYNQVDDKIGQISEGLGDRLKEIKVGSLTKKNAAIKNTLKDLAAEYVDYSKNTAGKINTLSDDIAAATTADDIWDAAKRLDKMIPENVKKGANLSGKDQLIYNAWREARNAVNDHLDEIATMAQDEGVKTAFKSMSNLYHAKGQILKKIGDLTKPTEGVLSKAGKALKGAAGIGIIGGVGGYIGSKVKGAVE